MAVAKARALELIDKKINEFQKLLADADVNNLYSSQYTRTYAATEEIIRELFSDKDVSRFRLSVAGVGIVVGPPEEELQEYKKHISDCIDNLSALKEKAEIHFPDDRESKADILKGGEKVIPFVAMSFLEEDIGVNDYFTGILEALQVEFLTGERYSKESVPQKIKDRIERSDLFIGIFVRRSKIENGGYTTPSWLIKELGIAQGKGKDAIALVERGIDDIGGLDYEKEVIYFKRSELKEIQKATLKFLEALVEHGVIQGG